MLLDCIRSLVETRGSLSLEVCVIDDASDPPLRQEINREFPDILVLRNEEHQSFSYSHNRALKKLGGKYVIVVNDDTYFHEGTLQTIYDEFEVNPRVGMIIPRVEAPGGNLDTATIRPEPTVCELITRWNYTRVRKLQFRLDPEYYDGHTKHNIEVGSGACMAIRRATMDEIGLLDERFPFYLEDVDWMLRVRRAGWILRYVPAALVTHYGAVSAKKRNFDMESCHYYAIRHYLRKWYAASFALHVHRLLSAANYFGRAIYWRAVALTRPGDQSVIARATGYWQLLVNVIHNPDYDQKRETEVRGLPS